MLKKIFKGLIFFAIVWIIDDMFWKEIKKGN
jgi:hypothetical protein